MPMVIISLLSVLNKELGYRGSTVAAKFRGSFFEKLPSQMNVADSRIVVKLTLLFFNSSVRSHTCESHMTCGSGDFISSV